MHRRITKVAAVIQMEHDGVRWELEPDFRRLLPEVVAGLVFGARCSTGGIATRIVSGKTYRIRRFPRLGWPTRWRRVFDGISPARQCWVRARELGAMEVPVVRHLAVGETTCGESILITEQMEGLSLDAAAAVCAEPIYDFFNRLYRRGVTLTPLRPEDVVVRTKPLDIRLVNVEHAVVARTVREPDRLRMLASLRVFLPLPVPPQVERESVRLRKEWVAEKAASCLGSDTEFTSRELGRLHWRVRVDGMDPVVESILRAPDVFLERDAWLMQSGGGVKLGRSAGLVMKRFSGRKGAHGHGWAKLSPGLRCFVLARQLELSGVATPRSVAAAEEEPGRILRQSYFMTEEIPAGQSLARWPGNYRHVLREAATLLGRLHGAGFSHDDLQETNFVFDLEGRAHLVGFDGLNYGQDVLPERARTDLQRFAENTAGLKPLTKLDRRIFIRAYCQARRIRPREVFTGVWRMRNLSAIQRGKGPIPEAPSSAVP